MIDLESISDSDLICLIDDDGEGLMSWEIEFVEDLIAFAESGKLCLSKDQRETAERIYVERVLWDL